MMAERGWRQLASFANCEWAAQVTSWGVARVLLWAGLFLWLLGLLPLAAQNAVGPVPFSADLKDTAVVPMLKGIAPANPSGFRSDLAAKAPGRLRIAWIGGSELQVFMRGKVGKSQPGESTFLPLEVVRRLEQETGREVEVLLYLIYAGRTFGYYPCLLNALENHCDAIVFSCNPVWCLNNTALSLDQGLFSSVAFSREADSWGRGLVMLFGGGRYLLLGALENNFSAVRNRGVLHEWLSPVQLFAPNPRPAAPKPPVARSLPELLKPPSLKFWARFEGADGEKLQGMTANEWQRFCSRYAAAGGGLAEGFMEHLLAMCQDKKLPVLLYLAPASNQALSDPVFSRAIITLERFASRLRADSADDGLVILPETPTRTVHDLVFRDFIHLQDAGSMDAYLAAPLRQIIEKAEAAR
jgi:hypothetical protein